MFFRGVAQPPTRLESEEGKETWRKMPGLDDFYQIFPKESTNKKGYTSRVKNVVFPFWGPQKKRQQTKDKARCTQDRFKKERRFATDIHQRRAARIQPAGGGLESSRLEDSYLNSPGINNLPHETRILL